MKEQQFAMSGFAEYALVFGIIFFGALGYRYTSAELSLDGQHVLTQVCDDPSFTEVDDPQSGMTRSYEDCGALHAEATPVSVWFQELLPNASIGAGVLAAIGVGLHRNW